MNRIESIKCVLQNLPSHKPSLPIIEPDGDKRHAGKDCAGQCTCAYDRHQQFIVSQQIDEKDKPEAYTSIVRTQHNRYQEQWNQILCQILEIILISLNHAKSEIPEEKSKENIPLDDLSGRRRNKPSPSLGIHAMLYGQLASTHKQSISTNFQ